MKILIFILLIFPGMNLWAQEFSAVAQKPKEIVLAGKFLLKFNFTGEARISQVLVSTAALEGNPDFAVLKIIKKSDSELDLEVLPFNIGISTFPALQASIFSGDKIFDGKTPELPLEIKPAFEIKEPAIRDIHPIFPFIDWMKVLLYALLGALAVWGIRKYLKKKSSAASPALIPITLDTRTPYQKALAEVDELIASGKIENGEIKEFYTGLSDILRVYLESEFKVKAVLMTTSDIIKSMKNSVADIKTVIEIREYFDLCDLVKFAKFFPSAEETREAAEKTKKILSELDSLITKKRFEEARIAAEAAEKK